jgi:excisionase family DNA binding protein
VKQLALSIVEAAQAAAISRSTLYEAIGRGELRVLKIGRRSVILVEDLSDWLRGRPLYRPLDDQPHPEVDHDE